MKIFHFTCLTSRAGKPEKPEYVVFIDVGDDDDPESYCNDGYQLYQSLEVVGIDDDLEDGTSLPTGRALFASY